MNEFFIEKLCKIPKMKNPIMIEGLPGIGNVARIVSDFLISKMKAKKIMNIYSKYFPNSVFIDKNKLIDLPKVELFHSKYKKRDYVIVIGDIQPADESHSYIFSNMLVNLAKKLGINEIITLGGINVKTPQEDVVFGACTHESYIPKLKKIGVKFDRKGAVIIVGAAGLMLGLCRLKKMRGFVLLAETAAYRSNLGVSAAKSVLKILTRYLNIKFPLDDIISELDYIKEFSKKENIIKKKIMSKTIALPEPQYLKYIG